MGGFFHPTDLSSASQVAFQHALKLALAAGSELTIMHVNTHNGRVHHEDLPGVRDTLQQWKVITPSPGGVGEMPEGLSVRKIVAHKKDPVKSCQHYLDEHAVNMVVLAVHQYAGRSRWLHHSTGEPIAKGAGEKSLFVPYGVDGFVNDKDGSLSLQNILLPIANHPSPRAAIDAASELITMLKLPAGNVTLLYVGDEGDVPTIRLPESSAWTWKTVIQQGNVVENILQIAASHDLVVMTTEGRHGFLDALRGSTTEQVLRKISCPLLVAPA